MRAPGAAQGPLGGSKEWGETRALSLHLAQSRMQAPNPQACSLLYTWRHLPSLAFGACDLGICWGAQVGLPEPPGLPRPQARPCCAAWAGYISVVLETLMRDQPSLSHGMQPRG